MDVMLKVTPADVFSSMVTVRAVGPDSYGFEEVASLNGSNLQLQDVPSTEALPDEIDFHDPAVLEWQVSPDGGTIWLGGARSENRAYVTLAAPNTGSLFHTLLHNSCRDADGLTDEAQVIAAIWSDFTDRAVYRVDPTGKTQGTKLTYYGNWSCQYYSTAHLLEHGDGQCGAWAKFFIDEMGAQGINHDNEYVQFFSKNALDSSNRFIVKEWIFTTAAGVSEDPQGLYPYLNLPDNQLIVNNGYDFIFAQVADGTGVEGQGIQNPASLFNNHQIVKFGGTYYDPSYGLTYASLSAIDSDAIEGHSKRMTNWGVDEDDVGGLDLNGNGSFADQNVRVPVVYIFQKNGTSNDLWEIFHQYP